MSEEDEVRNALYMNLYLRRETTLLYCASYIEGKADEEDEETPTNDVFLFPDPSSSGVEAWKALVHVREETSPWSTALFLLDIRLPSHYPFGPPSVLVPYPLPSHPLVSAERQEGGYRIPFEDYYIASIEPLKVSVLSSLKWYLGLFFSAPSEWGAFSTQSFTVDQQQSRDDTRRQSILRQIGPSMQDSPYVRDVLRGRALAFFLEHAAETSEFVGKKGLKRDVNGTEEGKKPFSQAFKEWFFNEFLSQSRNSA